MMKRRSFLACTRRSRSRFGLAEMPSSTAEMARTVPALKAALRGFERQCTRHASRERERKRATHCCTPGAQKRKPAEPRRSLMRRTMLLVAMRHFSVLMFVVEVAGQRRRKNLGRSEFEKVRSSSR